jgi:hypothetical protein
MNYNFFGSLFYQMKESSMALAWNSIGEEEKEARWPGTGVSNDCFGK